MLPEVSSFVSFLSVTSLECQTTRWPLVYSRFSFVGLERILFTNLVSKDLKGQPSKLSKPSRLPNSKWPCRNVLLVSEGVLVVMAPISGVPLSCLARLSLCYAIATEALGAMSQKRGASMRIG